MDHRSHPSLPSWFPHEFTTTRSHLLSYSCTFQPHLQCNSASKSTNKTNNLSNAPAIIRFQNLRTYKSNLYIEQNNPNKSCVEVLDNSTEQFRNQKSLHKTCYRHLFNDNFSNAPEAIHLYKLRNLQEYVSSRITLISPVWRFQRVSMEQFRNKIL